MIGINDTMGEGAFFMLILITFYLFSGYCFVYSRAKIQQKKNEIFCFKTSGNKNYYKFVFDWNMYKTGSISESLTPYPPVTDEKYPCRMRAMDNPV